MGRSWTGNGEDGWQIVDTASSEYLPDTSVSGSGRNCELDRRNDFRIEWNNDDPDF